MFFQKKWVLGLALLLVAGLMAGCSDDDMAVAYVISDGGAFDTPDGASAAGVASGGDSYSFSFSASDGDLLTFATMYVQSNDLFFSTDEAGIDLFDSSGNAMTGDVTSQVVLFDAGTEVNEEPGVGGNQAPRQSGTDTGTDENGTVETIANTNDGFTYPAVADVLGVSIAEASGTFTVTISVDAASDTPLAPGVYVIFTGSGPIFNEGSGDRGEGLESLAEDGDPTTLATSLGF